MKHATLTARTAISDHDKKVIALVRVCIGFTNQPIQELAENYTISFIGITLQTKDKSSGKKPQK